MIRPKPLRYPERMQGPPEFDSHFREQFRSLVQWRRDVRNFQPTPLPDGLLESLLEMARLAPSVGLSEPWRFVRVRNTDTRILIRSEFERANTEALSNYSGPLAALYARLKLSGLDSAPEHLAVFADVATEKGFGLGRATMPEMLEYSVVGAIGTLWLAARAHHVGLGWVSILDPARVSEILAVPANWRLIAYLCLGYPTEDCLTPELERSGWESRRPGSVALLER